MSLKDCVMLVFTRDLLAIAELLVDLCTTRAGETTATQPTSTSVSQVCSRLGVSSVTRRWRSHQPSSPARCRQRSIRLAQPPPQWRHLQRRPPRWRHTGGETPAACQWISRPRCRRTQHRILAVRTSSVSLTIMEPTQQTQSGLVWI